MNPEAATGSAPANRERMMKIAFALLALLSLLAGAGLYLFASQLGLDIETSRIIATAFIGAGILDALVLYCWERLFSRSSA